MKHSTDGAGDRQNYDACMEITRLGNLKMALGECPVWHGQQLWVMDCRAGLIHALDPDTGLPTATHEAPPPTGSFAFNHDGHLVVALKEEIVALNPQSGALHLLARLDVSHPHLRLNDGISLDDGSFVVGTMHVPREPGEPLLGGLYRLDTGLQLRKIEEGLGITNGPCVNPVNGRFLVADSAARIIWSYSMAPGGSLSDKQVFVNTDAQGSGPDGCCFDTAGGLWTALVRAGAVARFDMQGQMTHRIALPVAHPSALCFGGPDMAELFVTSISDSGRLSASGPLDGAVLRLRGLGFCGLARPLCRMPL